MADQSVVASAGFGGAARAAIRKASAATGVSFDYLMKTALRESSLRADAEAKTSTAAGLFQFIEQTWLGVVKKYGDRHGLAEAAGHIRQDESGRFLIADTQQRAEVLALRFDADAAAALAGELAGENKRLLEEKLGRPATAADLYAAHFLGPAKAVNLLKADKSAPAAEIVPSAAKANAPVFYEGVRARTVGEVIAGFAKSMGENALAPPPLRDIVFEKSADAPAPNNTAQTVAGEAVRTNMRMAETAPPVEANRLSLTALRVLLALDPAQLLAGRDPKD
ncbi:MAG: hypothetical protein AAGD92_03040 [Pseudomonadota bacterium]